MSRRSGILEGEGETRSLIEPAGRPLPTRQCVAVKSFGSPGVTIPPGKWVAPAGSYRSGGGGNETAEAFETTGRKAVRRSGRP